MGRVATHLHLNQRGILRVELEQTTLLPGDDLVGVVYVRITKPIPCAHLQVTIRGTQRLRWLTQIDGLHIPHWRKLTHLQHAISLVDHNAMFLPGVLQYPFSFKLPTHTLPPSLRFKRCHVNDLEAVRASVSYAVDATLVVDAFTTADLRTSTSFTVEQPITRTIEDSKPVAAQQDTTVKLLGLVKSGKCRINLQLSSDVYCANSTVEALVTLDLHTTRRLQYVKLALDQDATINRHCKLISNRPKHGGRSLSSRTFDPAELGLGPSTSTGVGKRILQLPLSLVDSPKGVTGNLLLPTLASHFLAITYHVAVECHFAMAKTVLVRVPVTIVRNQYLDL